MSLRLLAILLFLTLSAPAGVWGTIIHSCDQGKEVARLACCQSGDHGQTGPEEGAQLKHRCDIRVLVLDRHRLATSFKTLADDSLSAISFLSPLTSIRPERSISPRFSILRHSFVKGAGPPVFLRTCSFLI